MEKMCTFNVLCRARNDAIIDRCGGVKEETDFLCVLVLSV